MYAKEGKATASVDVGFAAIIRSSCAGDCPEAIAPSDPAASVRTMSALTSRAVELRGRETWQQKTPRSAQWLSPGGRMRTRGRRNLLGFIKLELAIQSFFDRAHTIFFRRMCQIIPNAKPVGDLMSNDTNFSFSNDDAYMPKESFLDLEDSERQNLLLFAGQEIDQRGRVIVETQVAPTAFSAARHTASCIVDARAPTFFPNPNPIW